MKGKFYILSTHCTAIETGQASEPVGKRACLLNPNQIPELIMGTGSNDSLCGVVAMEDEEYCAEVLPQHLRLLGKYTACSSAQAPLSLDSAILKKNVQNGSDPQTQQQPKLHWTLPFHLQKSVEHTLTVGLTGKNNNEAPHINDCSMLFSVFMLHLTLIVILLVVEI
jgi:hypothetical protein